MNGMIQLKEHHDKKKQAGFLLIALMLAAFCILKVLRGNDVETTTAGGVWNVISLVYYPIFLVAFLGQKKYHIRAPFVWSFLYSILALLLAVVHMTALPNLYGAYRLLMLPYPAMVFWTFYLCSEDSPKGEKIILAGYMVSLALNLYAGSTMQFEKVYSMTQSDIYFSLGLFPFALQFIKKKYWRAMVISLQFVAVFFSDKRSGLISFVIALVVYYLIDVQVKAPKQFFKALKTIVLVAVAIGLFYVVSRYLDNVFDMGIYDRLFRLSEDGGSGRTNIYRRVWNGFRSSPFLEQVFGHGMNTISQLGGTQAHNDLLEVLYDYGMFGLIPLIVFYLTLIVECVRLVKRRSPYAAAFTFSLIVGLFLAMFSYFIIFYTYVTCYFAFWGYVLCMENKRMKTDGGTLHEHS